MTVSLNNNTINKSNDLNTALYYSKKIILGSVQTLFTNIVTIISAKWDHINLIKK
jgi:hypothetical protein